MRVTIGTVKVGLAAAAMATAAVGMGAAMASDATASGSQVSVSFHGSAHRPEIVIQGHGFGSRPTPNLPISPEHAGAAYHSDCSKQRVAGNGEDGHDYGKRKLGIGWGPTAPTGYNAGVYVPGSYIDCIGLRIVSYSSTKVVLRPGCQYALYPKLKAGDDFLISINGVHVRGHVHY